MFSSLWNGQQRNEPSSGRKIYSIRIVQELARPFIEATAGVREPVVDEHGTRKQKTRPWRGNLQTSLPFRAGSKNVKLDDHKQVQLPILCLSTFRPLVILKYPLVGCHKTTQLGQREDHTMNQSS
ncbi:hypothetical protein EDD18DRAFT_1365141 [Armillaria luteobubalina]|uniref:Uncharacterized protein n=1 Tax=Armillaria luteobubalina TaxID=153913 RepID=A0AA39P631_9AGAR|nr:hypothetical protein EDD18DRAFT_1365141 [Armillaria luteobubalina]